MKIYIGRIEIRVDERLKKDWIKFCSNKSASDAARAALENYMQNVSVRDLLLQNFHDKKFRDSYLSFIDGCPPALKKFFEDLLGDEEEHLVQDAPGVLLLALSDVLVTKRGANALSKKVKKLV